jgi:hypothetical protein
MMSAGFSATHVEPSVVDHVVEIADRARLAPSEQLNVVFGNSRTNISTFLPPRAAADRLDQTRGWRVFVPACVRDRRVSGFNQQAVEHLPLHF